MSRLPIASLCLAGFAFAAWPNLNAQTAATKSATAARTPAKDTKAAPAKPTAGRPDTTLLGTWRVARGVIAPWVPVTEKRLWDAKAWIGQTITFDAKRVTGPSSLKCSNASYAATSFPAEALFQGGLKEPAKTAAQEVGFAKFPVIGTSLHCDVGLYEFHKLDATTELVAVSNVIWTLDRSPGALAAATTPAGVVQRFLESHFGGDMGFSAATVASRSAFMTPALLTLTRQYFAKPVVKDEVPDIDGDPFTDSQEYPTRFSVSAPATKGTSASVRVRFSDAFGAKTLTYQLLLNGGVWRIDDVRNDAGPTLRHLLAVPK